MTNNNLVDQLVADGYLRTPRLIEAFRQVDRADFVPVEIRDQAYANIPLPTMAGQTISQPLTVAIMLEELQPRVKEYCLDVGAGSGWVAALLGQLVGPRGKVIAVERISHLVDLAKKNLAQDGVKNVELIRGDASHGWPEGAPFDIIHVAAATDKVPAEFISQLAVGGRLIIPIGEFVQDLAVITKIKDNRTTERRLPGFQFVPLINKK